MISRPKRHSREWLDEQCSEDLKAVPGIKFVDHVAIAVKQGELDGQVKAYEMLGFKEIHREEVLGKRPGARGVAADRRRAQPDSVARAADSGSPVQKLIERNGGRGGLAHVAFRVESAQQAFDAMKASGFQTHRQGSTQRLARDDGLLRSSQIESRKSIWVSDRNC
jgi:methylmalonyl-CoA/ethylmalonyl-CoA epimerase